MKEIIDLKKLDTSQKLELIDQLWDEIRSSEELTPPNWHLDILKERETKYLAGDEKLIDWETFKKSMIK
jgi:hypothetical protein